MNTLAARARVTCWRLGEWSWLVGVGRVVKGNGVRGVGKHMERFPSGALRVVVLVTGPLDEVTELSSVVLRVENLVDLEFLVVVDDDGGRRRLFPSGNAIRVSGLQEGDVEDGME